MNKLDAVILFAIDLRNENIRIFHSVGILTGDSKIMTMRDGRESEDTFQFVAVWNLRL